MALRYLTPLFLAAAAGCSASSHTASPIPQPEAASDQEVGAGAIDQQGLAAFPAAEVTDSAADAAVLEALANSSLDTTDLEATIRATGGPDALVATPVSWDMEVEPFISHSRVRYYLDFFQGKARDRFAIWLTRMPRYEDRIRQAMVANDLPSDMVYLALIESGFSNSAVSRSRAVGMWQFMRGTAKMYGLRVDYWIDERRDPVKATEAAARHLADLRDRFGSLFLAAAAYNAGAGRVSRGLKRLGSADEEEGISDETFFQLYNTRYLVRETKDYVPKLIAAALIAKEPERYGFDPPPAIAPMAYDSITVPDATGLDVIARLAGVPLDTIRGLNPHIIRLATPPGESMVVRVPVGTGEAVADRYAEVPPSKRVTYRVHVVRSGETFGHIARTYGVTVTALEKANPRVRPRAIRIGSRLVIPTGGIPSAELRLALRTAGNNVPTSRYHRVRSGESLWTIGRRYGVSTTSLKRWNRLRSDVIRPGQRLRVAR